MAERFYPIGEPGQAWGDAERAQWRAAQKKQRSYADDVVGRVRALGEGAATRFDVVHYGEVSGHSLLALVSKNPPEDRPTVVVTGGVHGYETSGVHGALAFVEDHAKAFLDRVNLVVVPCVSPWAYEHIQRWNESAIDPNRSFRDSDAGAAESVALWRFATPYRDRALMHIDLHETTDTDESEFRPAVAARDGKPFSAGTIPDGFYLVDDTEKPQPAFQKAIISAVEKVTHIAPADDKGELIGCKVTSPGVIGYAVKSLGLCAGLTNARFTTTTEVYPDSPKATPAICNAAQVAAVVAGLDFVLAA
jgi:hypothetical protein